MRTQDTVSPRLLAWLICGAFFAFAVGIVWVYGAFAQAAGIAVSDGLDLGEQEFVRYITQMLLAPGPGNLVLATLTISAILGFATTMYFGLRPAFPWQAELYRTRATQGAWACVGGGLITPLVQVGSTYGIASIGATVSVLSHNDQIPVLFMILLLPVVVAVAAVTAYFAGLAVPTHIGVRWILPGWLKAAAWGVYQLAKYIDPVLGRAGDVLDAIRTRSEDKA